MFGAARASLRGALALLALPTGSVLATTGKRTSRPAERAWVERAAALALAAKRSVEVAEFRRDIDAHRVALRRIVQAHPNPPEPVLKLHRVMVLTNALLHAAAECHVGGRIVCPADLMQHIEDQVRNGFEHLHALEAGSRRGGGEAPRRPA
ncbi:MAG: hypothetical protein JNL30_06050 [Rubrivivax sp.]|nr:hypothetical protein [Rubrivivax sp.]